MILGKGVRLATWYLWKVHPPALHPHTPTSTFPYLGKSKFKGPKRAHAGVMEEHQEANENGIE